MNNEISALLDKINWVAKNRAMLFHAGYADGNRLANFIKCAFVAFLR